ncbi:MAG: hypothetical protein HKN94_10815 [Acidimicrobiales bacterium]|nr:hypothetical protein [Acidimicrobiales bacterium]RZV47714.1 MAG: hypothetical protein EX269_04135 [Acidimicrobiales bacterium]
MSDVFEGPGWWMASDAKWYAPHLHPNPAYRRAWAYREAPPEPERHGPKTNGAPSMSLKAPVALTASAPAVGAVFETLSPPPVPVAALGRRMPPAVVTPYGGSRAPVVDLLAEAPAIDLTEPAVPPAIDLTEPAAPPIPDQDVEDITERVLFEPDTNDIEIVADVDDVEITYAVEPARMQPNVVAATPSTALVYVGPETVVYEEPATRWDRMVAAALFLAGITLIVGTFLTWSDTPSGELSGWDMGDGIATVLAGILGSAAAGPILVGFRHMIPKTIALISGLVAVVVTGLAALRVVNDDVLNGTTLGVGVWVVIGGSLLMLLAAWADRSTLAD